MSLINDALKRASQSSRQTPPGKGFSTGSPLQPVGAGRPRKSPINFAVLAIPLLVILLLGGATWGFMSWKKQAKAAKKTTPTSKQAQNPGSAPAKIQPTPPPAVPATAAQTPGTPPNATQTATNTLRSTPSTPPTEKPVATTKPQATPPTLSASVKPQKSAPTISGSVAPPAAAPSSPTPPRGDPPKDGKAFPPIKLQGIAFRIKNPSVVINGKVLALGEDLDGLVVKKIERTSVTLEWSGQIKVFSIK